MQGRSAIVVGAGLSGLTAAFRLQQAGVAVTLLEARDRVAANLEPVEVDGFTLDGGGRAMPTRAPSLHALAMELGLGLELRRAPLERAVLRDHSTHNRSGEIAIRGRRPPRGLRAAIRARRAQRLMRWYGAFLDPRDPSAGLRLDDRSIADFTKLYLGRAAGARLFAPLFRNHFGLDVAETSRLTALLLFDPLGQPDVCTVSGLSKLAGALAKPLRDVRLNTRVVATLPGGRGVTLASGELVSADATVLAVPGDDVRALVPDLTPAEDVMSRGFATEDWAALVVVTKDARGAHAPPSWIAGGHFITGVFELPAPAGQPGDARARVFTIDARGGAGRLDRDVLLREAETLFPGLAAGATAVELVVRDRSAPRFGIGHYRAVHRMAREVDAIGPRRALVYAGRYLYGPHPEAAVLSGERAAERAIAAMLNAPASSTLR